MFLTKLLQRLNPLAGERTPETTLTYAQRTVTPQTGESVLEALLEAGHDIPNGCRAGACQCCMMVCDDLSTIPPAAQEGLSSAQKEQGCFLSCSCIPEQSMSVSLPAASSIKVQATVKEKTLLNDMVIRLRLAAELSYKAGQYIQVTNQQGVSRSYSIASVHSVDDFIELQIKSIEGGQFSGWIRHSLHEGDTLTLSGAMGECFYTSTQDKQQPLLLAGIGTGLAPLYGILRDALHQNHTGKITLILGAQEASQFYLVDSLKSLAAQHANLEVHFIALKNESNCEGMQTGNIYELAKTLIPDCAGHKIFLCGADSFVKKLKRQCFLAGAGMQDISADAFVSTGAPEAESTQANAALQATA